MINRSIKRLFAVLALVSSAGMMAKASQSNNLFLARAFSANSAREMVMMGAPDKNADGWSAGFSVAGSYQRMWEQDKGKGIGSRPFWSGTNEMTTGAADAAGKYNLDPWNMGLGPVTTNGSIKLDPVVYQAGADFMLAVNAAANEPGFYGMVKGSVAVMSIDPQLTDVKKVTAVDYAKKTTSTADLTKTPVYKNMVEAFVGDKELNDIQKMSYGKINGKQSATKFGDIELSLGYNFIADEDKCLGLGLRASGPTGNKPEAVYVLEPVVGRGGSWGLGGELHGHMTAWEGSSGDKALNVKLNANAMHLFKSKSPRSYDLKESPGSKYMLVASFDDAFAYQNKINNLVNLSTLESESSFGVEADASLALEYNAGDWSATLGYNFWGRSAETLKITGESTQLVGSLSRTGATLDTPQVIPNAGINKIGDAAAAAAAANTYKLSADTLDVAAAEAKAACSSKVFGGLRYNWMDSDYMPHLGLMGEFELSHSDNNALPQWSVGVEGGVSF